MGNCATCGTEVPDEELQEVEHEGETKKVCKACASSMSVGEEESATEESASDEDKEE